MKHLKAFTLIELIISMMLSGILLSLAINVISTMISISSIQNQSNRINNNIISIHSSLSEYFSRSSYIKFNDPELKFIFSDSSRKSLSFFSGGMLLKNSNSIDTLEVPIDSLKITRIDSTTLIIRNLSFTVINNGIPYPFYFSKDYENQLLFNIDINEN